MLFQEFIKCFPILLIEYQISASYRMPLIKSFNLSTVKVNGFTAMRRSTWKQGLGQDLFGGLKILCENVRWMQNLLICSCQSVSEAFCASVCQMTRLLVSDSGCHCLLSCHQTFRTFCRHMLICPLQVKLQLTLSGLTLALPLIIDILR